MMMERCQCMNVRRYRMVSEESAHDLPQPLPLFRDRQMSPLSQFLLDLLKFCPHSVAPRLPAKQELALFRLAADKGEPQETESLRPTKPAFCALMHGITAEHDQPGLFRIKRQRKLLQPLPHRVPEPPGITLVLKAEHDV
jgi:hypothetical protein